MSKHKSVKLGGLVTLLMLTGCSSGSRPADLQSRALFEQLQPGVTVKVSGNDYSRVSAVGLSDVNRLQLVDGMATGCVENAGEIRGMTRSDGWVCYLPMQNREAFALLYTRDSIQLLRSVEPYEGLHRELVRYGYVR